MKRAAIILIPIFLILSIAITVYVVVTQRIELRKKAEEVPYKTSFSSRTITDNCSGGPFVEIQATNTTYDAKTGVQSLNLVAKRRGGGTSPTATTAPAVAGPTNTPAASTATSAPTATRAPTATTAPTATSAPASTTSPLSTTAPTATGAVHGVAEGDIEIYLSEVGCANPVGDPGPNNNQCNSCSSADPVFFNRGEQKYVIPAGVSEIPISVSITKPVTQLTCGCTQMDVHINRVVYAGNLSQTAGQQRSDCSTLGSAVNSKPRQYLYAVGWNGNCAGVTSPTPQVSVTSTPPAGAGLKQPICTSVVVKKGGTAVSQVRRGDTITVDELGVRNATKVHFGMTKADNLVCQRNSAGGAINAGFYDLGLSAEFYAYPPDPNSRTVASNAYTVPANLSCGTYKVFGNPAATYKFADRQNSPFAWIYTSNPASDLSANSSTWCSVNNEYKCNGDDCDNYASTHSVDLISNSNVGGAADCVTDLTVTGCDTTTENQHPVCTGLSASPTSGTEPVTVHFVGSGTDPDGPIQKFEFTYGDGKNQTIEKNVGNTGSVEIDHTYTVSGSFVATLRIQDNNGVWSDPTDNCSVTITTSGGPTVTPSPTTTQKGGVAPTATRTPTPTRSASASATPVAPNVPVSGGILPTLAIGLSGLLIIGLGLLLAL